MRVFQDRPYQRAYIEAIRQNWREGKRRQILVAPTGSGKCLGKGTPVIMYDGTVKPVESIVAGELLMGPDSTPRKVLSTCHGQETLYRITPTKGDAFVCNESHILSLKLTPTTKTCLHEVVNISVLDYLKKHSTFKHRAKLYRTGIDMPHVDVPLDPYFVGLWLADGTSDGPCIHKPDPEVAEFAKQFAQSHGLVAKNYSRHSGKCASWAITNGNNKCKSNPVLDAMRSLSLIGNKHIPDIYIRNSREVRLQILAGILDGDGHMCKSGYEFSTTIEKMADAVQYIARSLGFAANKNRRVTSCQTGATCENWRVYISGDCSLIPCRIARKKSPPRKQIKDVLVSGFKVENIGVGDYYGFEIDGDRLFLLGDFTVTHNTRTLGIMAQEMMQKSESSKLFVIAERRRLVEQLAEQMQMCGLRWHVEMANLPDGSEIGNEWVRRDPKARIWIGSRDTVLSRVIRHEWMGLPKFDLMVADECHRFDRGKSRELIDIVNAPYVIGMTATPCFADGTGLGAKNWDAIVQCVTMKELVEGGYLVPVRYFAPPELGKKRKKGDKTGIAGDPVSHWMRCAEGKRTVALFSGVKEAYAVRDRFREAHVTAEVIEADTPHKERNRIFNEIRKGNVLWCAGVGTLDTGVDIPEWEVGQILCRCGSLPRFRQFGGRIMRACPEIGKKYAILLDHSGATMEHGMLDEEMPWELNEDDDISNRIKKEREKGSLSNPVCCGNCGCLFAGTPVCPECGTAIPKRERKTDPDIERELLVELNAIENEAQLGMRMQREWITFLRMCVAKNWPAKKANIMFKAKFGEWPDRAGVTPAFRFQDRDISVRDLCPNLVPNRMKR